MSPEDLRSLAVIAFVAVVTVLIVERFPKARLNVVVLELLAGIVVGPAVLDIAHTTRIISSLAALGLAFLMSTAGYELDFQRVKGRPIELAVLGWGISLGLGLGLGYARQSTGRVLDGLTTSLALTDRPRDPAPDVEGRGDDGLAVRSPRPGHRDRRGVRPHHRHRAVARHRRAGQGHVAAAGFRAVGRRGHVARHAAPLSTHRRCAPEAPVHEQPTSGPHRGAAHHPAPLGGLLPRPRRPHRRLHGRDHRPPREPRPDRGGTAIQIGSRRVRLPDPHLLRRERDALRPPRPRGRSDLPPQNPTLPRTLLGGPGDPGPAVPRRDRTGRADATG